jgi:hypothetical protein
MALARLIGD